ncbi:MAG: hypothetical protein JNK29_19555 [Anaerolineales bacterium]|nr:hypothetical protein [Anaerolineales bacterium]
MFIQPVDLDDRRQVRQFLELPAALYRAIPQYVPPLESDARAWLDYRRNPFYRHSQAGFWLAMDGGRPIGRLAALDNRRYNDFNHERTAFFYLFECEDHRAAALGLFAAAADWARGRGLDKLLGPKGFTPLDGLGLLVQGFEHRPAFGLPYNPAYYVDLVEAAGFETDGELVSGYLDARTFRLPERVHQVARLVQERRGLRVLRFQSRNDLRAVLPKLKQLYNGALGGTSGNVPLTDAEVEAIAGQLLWFADPRLIKIIVKGDEPVGFLFAYPDVSAALQRTRGRLFPFGWLTLLWELRQTRWLNVNGAGVVEQYRGLGGTALLFSELEHSLREGGRFDHADLVQIGVENDRMQRELRDLGIDFYKRHRLYRQRLAPAGSGAAPTP